MGEPCPKCDHRRDDDDAVPPGECPKCGIVYAKFEATQRQLEAARLAALDAPRRAGQIGKPVRKVDSFNWNLVSLALASGAVVLIATHLGEIGIAIRNGINAATDINSSATSGVALTVTRLSCKGTGNVVVATGEVQNRSQKTLTRLDLNMTIYDRQGSTMHRRAALDQASLPPLQVSTFRLEFPIRPSQAGDCRVSGFVDADGRDIRYNFAPGTAPDDDEHAK